MEDTQLFTALRRYYERFNRRTEDIPYSPVSSLGSGPSSRGAIHSSLSGSFRGSGSAVAGSSSAFSGALGYGLSLI